MSEMLLKAADQFALYADEQAEEGTPEAVTKAMEKHWWALACAKAAAS